MTYTCSIDTPLGMMTAAAENNALTGLWFDGQKYFPSKTAKWSCAPDHPVFAALRLQLDRYFSGAEPRWDLPLVPQGTEFRKRVWAVLTSIPYVETVSYGEIAKEIAVATGQLSMSAQAVGGAVGHNPISILIPCHRVVGCNRSLTGYAGGLERKEALLRLEGVKIETQ
jgi:methylated-DNA-[protein]-cysteine S-methyltransferase